MGCYYEGIIASIVYRFRSNLSANLFPDLKYGDPAFNNTMVLKEGKPGLICDELYISLKRINCSLPLKQLLSYPFPLDSPEELNRQLFKHVIILN